MTVPALKVVPMINGSMSVICPVGAQDKPPESGGRLVRV